MSRTFSITCYRASQRHGEMMLRVSAKERETFWKMKSRLFIIHPCGPSLAMSCHSVFDISKGIRATSRKKNFQFFSAALSLLLSFHLFFQSITCTNYIMSNNLEEASPTPILFESLNFSTSKTCEWRSSTRRENGENIRVSGRQKRKKKLSWKKEKKMSGHDLIYRRLWREAGDGKKKIGSFPSPWKRRWKIKWRERLNRT